MPPTRNIQQVADYFQVSRWTIARRIRDGELPATKVGTQVLIADRDIAAHLATALLTRSEHPMADPQAGATATPQLYTLAEVSEMTRIPLRTLEKGARRKPPAFDHYECFDGRRRMTRAQIDALLEIGHVRRQELDAQAAVRRQAAEMKARGRRRSPGKAA